ncbi:MAG: hypothetical protein KC656_00825 [Myxococcales bacterium]|nr:hypothetical protein [Myxococcales bacterium]
MSHPVASGKTAGHVQTLLVTPDGAEVRGLSACSFYRPLEETMGDFFQQLVDEGVLVPKG